MKFSEYVQHYTIHLSNGDELEWCEDEEEPNGIIKRWGQWLAGKCPGEALVANTPLGPYAYIPYRNICWIYVGDVEKTSYTKED